MYKEIKLKIIVLMVMFFLGFGFLHAAEDKLTIYSPSYFDEQNHVYEDIHYLDNEALSFEFCTEADAADMSFYLKCGTYTENLVVMKNYNKEGCYFTNYNLRDLACAKFDLFIDYQINSKKKILKRTFKKQKESLLVNNVLEKNYQDLSDTDLSYYLIVLNDIQDKDNKENVDAYEKLKNARNNDDKCWPKTNCDLLTTTAILRNLEMAGYDKESRMIEDGAIYIDRRIIDNPKGNYEDENLVNDYEFEIDINHNFTSSVECDLEIDGDDAKTYDFDEDSDSEDKRIEKTATDSIDFSCEEDLDEISFKIYKEKIYDKDYDDEDKIDYSIDSGSLDDYDEFKYQIKITHDFSPSEEISCDLEIDGDDPIGYDFDEDSEFNDLIISDYFDEEINFDCDEELDNIKFDVYADLEEEDTYDNDDSFSYDIDFESEDTYKFDVIFEYDFQNNDEELNCSLELDPGRKKNYKFDEGDEVGGKLIIDNKEAAEKIAFSCQKELDKIELGVYDMFDRKQVDEEYLNTKSFTYTIPTDFSEYECIGENRDCEYSSNINSLLALEDSSIDKKSSLETFVDSFISEGDENEYYINDNSASRIIDTGRYLYYKSDDSLEDYLKFSQNNDGSWGEGAGTDKIIETSWAVLGIDEVDSGSEHVEDGKKWIYYNEPISGWGSLEKNSMAYFAIRDKLKPYLKVNIQNAIKDSTKFEIENPTIYNLKDVKITFENNLDEYLSYTENLGDLDGQGYVEFNISAKDKIIGSKTGLMTITGVDGKNKEVKLLEMYVNVQGPTPFQINAQNVTLDSTNKLITIEKQDVLNSYSFNCDYINPFNSAKEEVIVTNGGGKIVVDNPDSKLGNFDFDLNCKSDDQEFSLPVAINVKEENITFKTSEATLVLESLNDFSVNVTNIGQNIETLTLSVGGDYAGIIVPSEPTKKIAVGESREIYFTIPNKELLNNLTGAESGYVLIESSNGYQKRLSINFFLGQDTGNSGSNLIWYFLVGIIAAILIGLVFWRRKVLQDQERQAQQEHHQDDEFDLDGEFEF